MWNLPNSKLSTTSSSRTHFTNDFSFVIQCLWKLRCALVQIQIVWSLQSVAAAYANVCNEEAMLLRKGEPFFSRDRLMKLFKNAKLRKIYIGDQRCIFVSTSIELFIYEIELYILYVFMFFFWLRQHSKLFQPWLQ